MSASSNAETIRRLRAEAVLRGDCYMCRCRPKTETSRYCAECLARTQAYKQALYAKRAKTRKCVGCGGRPVRGERQCAACQAKSATRQSIWRGRRIEAGVCTRCGKAAPKPTSRCCDACTIEQVRQHAEADRARIAAGFCRYSGCGSVLHEGTTMCLHHLLKMRRDARDRAEARREA